MANARQQLVELLDRKVFDPILSKSEDDFSSEREKEELRDVQESTESEKHRFHDEYTSAKDVKDNYVSDLSSSTGKRKDKELDDLGLPKMPDVRDEFMRLCDKLGVK